MTSTENGSQHEAECEETHALRSPTKKINDRNQSSETKMSQQKFMAVYKVSECKKKFNHDKRQCMNWHSQADRRRNPFHIGYSTAECEKGLYCREYNKCPNAHNMLEKMFHPDLFKITRCIRGPNSTQCERGEFCAFAHSADDLRHPAAKDKLAAAAAARGGGGGGSFMPPSTLSTSTNHDSAEQPPARNRQQSPRATPSSNSPPKSSGPEGLSPSKPLTDSAALDAMQRNLVALIQSQGADGIISSELPKRFFDHFGTRLDLQDESGEKFRIKDMLHARADVAVSMHKGVQPKYVYCGPELNLSPSSSILVTGPSGKSPRGVGAEKAPPAQLSFLAAASAHLQPQERDQEEQLPEESSRIEAGGIQGGVSSDVDDNARLAFPSDRIGASFYPDSSSSSSSAALINTEAGNGNGTGSRDSGHGEHNEFLASSFFPSPGSSPQEGLSGLLGMGLISPPRPRDRQQPLQQISSSSFLDDTFSFPFFGESAGGFCGERDLRVSSGRDSDEDKDREIEDLKGRLEAAQLRHRAVCLERDQERRQLQAQIAQLQQKCASLEQRAGSSSSDSQFPQNAFALSASREPFSPQRTAASSPGLWTGF